MGVRLKNPNGPYPTGGFTFSDPHTAMQFPDDKADLHTIALQVVEHRKANPNIYKPSDALALDVEAIKGEILIQLCARQPSVCEDSATPGVPYPPAPGKPQPEIHRQQGRVCPKCQSADFTPIRCASCGGSRVSGWKCVQCGYQL